MMAMAAEGILTVAKFRGCLIGALVGDCLGAPFEGDPTVSRSILHKYLDKLEEPAFKDPLKMYTDDTSMTKSIAQSFLDNSHFNETDLAKRFVNSYYDNPRRGYGNNVVDVFGAMRKDKFRNVWAPARNQFGGTGSYGNGGAMRISPVALFAHSDYSKMMDIARKCTELTHTHRLGVNGALLQCAAIHMCLNRDAKQPLDIQQFTSELSEKIQEIEKQDEVFGSEEKFPYGKQVKLIEKLLVEDPAEFEEDICNKLGNSVAALYSVPTAIYCFLRGQKPVEFIKSENPFRRVLHLSILMGGDTDTIASMACAIAGAYHGEEAIDTSLQKRCEGLSEMIQLADNLFEKTKSISL